MSSYFYFSFFIFFFFLFFPSQRYVDLFTMSTNYLADDAESFNAFHPSRLMGIFDMLNADSLIDLVSGLGVPKKKLLISLPASAYKFTLKEKEKNVPGSPVEEEKPEVISQKEVIQEKKKMIIPV